MNVLFVMRSTIYVRNFESTLRLLAGRGHRVHVLADRHLPDSDELITRLTVEFDAITWSAPPPMAFSPWSSLGRDVRRALDYLRYLGAEYADAPKLRQRAEKGAPPWVLGWLRRPWVASDLGRGALRGLLRVADRAMPVNPDIAAVVAEHAPDLVLVTPLVEPGAPQAEYLRAARSAGVRTGLCVYSWDNLTNKGLIHDPLDLVTVWNEAIREEAVTLHGVPADRIEVTGAAAYDHWFDWRPSRDRETFCREVGLRADRPYLLYLCSSKFIAPDEVSFIRRWATEIRRLSPALAGAGVIVRPHPQHAEPWKTADLGLEQVVVWPPVGANPTTRAARSDYFDSIHHAAAVVGINTSAQIESAILGRAVYTVLAPEFAATQGGTLHYRHLRQTVREASTFEAHAAQLEDALRSGTDTAVCARFVDAFIRPFGRDDAATPRLVDALERVAARGRVVPDAGPWWGRAVRAGLGIAIRRRAASARGLQERADWQARQEVRRDAAKADRRDAREAAKRVLEERRELRRVEEAARLEAEARARAVVEQRAWQTYTRVRDALRSRRDVSAVDALDHWWDATPEMVATLRQHVTAIGSCVPEDFASRDSDVVRALKREAGALRKQAGARWFVHEPAGLGGFGFTEEGRFLNHDTARFFAALVALDDAAILPGFQSGGRRVVWELDGGWGGLAYQVKTLFPAVTYVISGPPTRLIVASAYLSALCPDADCRWLDRETAGRSGAVSGADFVFVPEDVVDAVRLDRLDLTLDLGTVDGQPTTCPASAARRAHALGSRFFFARTATGDPAGVAAAIAPWYWVHPVPPRRDAKQADEAGTLADPPFSYLAGWRRLVA